MGATTSAAGATGAGCPQHEATPSCGVTTRLAGHQTLHGHFTSCRDWCASGSIGGFGRDQARSRSL
eukprot:7512396-Alexandrium_andersonii.AAC.1